MKQGHDQSRPYGASVVHARSRRRRSRRRRLYVGNLSFDTNEQSLRDYFTSDGRTVEDVAIITDRDTGRPRGFGFVTMGSEEEAKSAIAACDGASLDGRSIRVNEAQDKRGGGGGGRRY